MISHSQARPPLAPTEWTDSVGQFLHHVSDHIHCRLCGHLLVGQPWVSWRERDAHPPSVGKKWDKFLTSLSLGVGPPIKRYPPGVKNRHLTNRPLCIPQEFSIFGKLLYFSKGQKLQRAMSNGEKGYGRGDKQCAKCHVLNWLAPLSALRGQRRLFPWSSTAKPEHGRWMVSAAQKSSRWDVVYKQRPATHTQEGSIDGSKWGGRGHNFVRGEGTAEKHRGLCCFAVTCSFA